MREDRITKKHHAWAIRTNNKENNALLGRFWWFGDKNPNPIHPQHEGCQISLFTTRAKAISALREMNNKEYKPYPNAKVIKVMIIIEEQ